MTILVGDLVLAKSQVMADVPEGGGAPVAATVIDGNSNSIFPDISEAARAGGQVNLRKVHFSVRTANVDAFMGANLIIAEPFSDPRVSATLFSTGSQFDRREEAAARLEAYLAKGPTYDGYLFGDHIAGQAAVSLLKRVEAPAPVVGDTIVLVYSEGTGAEATQYVRVTDVSVVERTFTDSSGDFKRSHYTLAISDVLTRDFPGFDALRLDSAINFAGKTKLRSTIVADAARYYGTVPLIAAGHIGDFTVNGSSIFTQLVPSTRQEVGIADARLSQRVAAPVKAGAPFTRNLALTFTTAQPMFIGGAVLPGSLSIVRGVTVTDKGGTLVDASGTQVGTVDYANGICTLSTNVFGTGSGSHAVTYTPAGTPTLVADSVEVPVTMTSQRMTYALTIDPVPARGSLQVEYRAGGRWYVLRDDGSGAVRGGDSSYGAGSINPTTGTVLVTLGALPDVDSSVIFSYSPAVVSRPITEVSDTGPALARAFGKPLTLDKAIKPGTLTITWNDGIARTATDSGGVLTGDATGVVNYATGFIDLRPNVLPPVGTALNIALTETAAGKDNIPSLTDGGSNWTGSLTGPLKPRSVELSVVITFYEAAPSGNGTRYQSLRITDNGSGSLQASTPAGLVTVGTVNYTSGAITLTKTVSGFTISRAIYGWKGSDFDFATYSWKVLRYENLTTSVTLLNGPGTGQPAAPAWAWWTGSQGNAVEFRNGGADGTVFSGSAAFDSLFLSFNAGGFGTSSTQATSITSFVLASQFHAFRESDSSWVREPSPTTGTGTVVGAKAVIGGNAGVLLTAWNSGGSSAVSSMAGASQPELTGLESLLFVDQATFRTAVSPLVNSGFQVAGNWLSTGAGFTATADGDGNISTGSAVVGSTPGSYGVFGTVNYEMGIARLRFGRRVPASMAGDDGVQDISDMGLAGVSFIESIPVTADTLRYNATGYKYLPLNPAILGLNPVRLPADGRVPIFRPGEFAVVGHKGTVGPATFTNGQVVNCGRGRLSRARVIGNDGVVIVAGYTADLDVGTVTITNVTGWSMPATIEHRIEDMAMVSDAQINGQITLLSALSHEFPMGSYISSALMLGDLWARVSVVFDLQTWGSVWADYATGAVSGANFNDASSPITVTNAGAITERWAVQFTSPTEFKVTGEHVGVIALGTTGTECAPVNPDAIGGAPFFTIPAAGWGFGWSLGNVLRFNTVAAGAPAWVARTILAGPETVANDSFTLLGRGDIDRP